ncbi:MAG: hypothetical protein PHX87_05050 [Candidatus Peribacteraceae bacterium]|nr:hypothetical protein [Candidatus Peribacteraceae bacterium]MDD5742763.1 hypothetical protein [Candidatus Peribacteraceae bacterium]
MNENDWLDRWHRGQYDFPSAKKYFHWKERYHGGYVRSKKPLSQSYELLYDKRQLLTVKIILQHEKDVRLFPKEERYIRSCLEKILSELRAFLDLYIAVEETEEESIARVRNRFEILSKKESKKEARADTKSFFKLTEQPRLEQKARNLVKTKEFTAEQLRNWRHWLGHQSHLNEGSVFRESSRVYLAHLSDAVLVQAEDTNEMVRVLNWFLYFLTGEVETVQGIIGSWIGPHCRFCHRAFIRRPNKLKQETCGRKECSDKLRNLNRRPKRRKKTA